MLVSNQKNIQTTQCQTTNVITIVPGLATLLRKGSSGHSGTTEVVGVEDASFTHKVASVILGSLIAV